VQAAEPISGYLHPGYAGSLTEFGRPRYLPASEGWILERTIADSADRDAMGCYPLFSCRNWRQLGADLRKLDGELISLALVADPLGDYDLSDLRSSFPDLVLPFKQHFVVDLGRPLETFVHPHHRRSARKALKQLQVERCASPTAFLDDWLALYRVLIERHGISGIAAFSSESFHKQLKVPGMVAFRAFDHDTTSGMVLWYTHGNKAYYHLGAYSARGYELRASFALFEFAINHFAEQGVEWLDLGAGAGINNNAGDGLTRFKAGWSNGVRTAYFCGRIFKEERYREILQSRNQPVTNYFPAYRAGEFL
jgi:Acetyltransferase (GNAT) domain